MTAELNPYKVLQVDPSADPEVIEAAYHALTRKWRPKDVCLAGSCGADQATERCL